MKRVIQILCVIICAFNGTAFAGDGHVKGKIEYIRTHDPANQSWQPPRFWFTLKGVTSAGGCQTWWSGTVLFVAETNEMFSTVMANYLANKEISLHYNTAPDTLGEGGYCRALYITMGNPPVNN